MKEAAVVINGKTLSNAQAMTVRVALESFSMDLRTDGLGSSETGRTIAEGYLACIAEIRTILYSK